MRVLVSHEFSGVIRRAFRARGCEAYSCDLLPSMDNSPYHLQCDFRTILHYEWDIAIFHPVCRYLCVSGISWNDYRPERAKLTAQAIKDFMACWNHGQVYRICIENPISIMSTEFRKPDQIIKPWQFGHPENKKTCLWVRGLPLLQETNNVYDYMMTLPVKERDRIHHEQPGIKNGLTREQRRSITYTGIADAMADQWLAAYLSGWKGDY